MVSFLILLRSLRVYALKQLFFSISVNVVATIRHYSPRFQRIIVEYITVMCSTTVRLVVSPPKRGTFLTGFQVTMKE